MITIDFGLNKELMKNAIETLVRSWVHDNRTYIEENFQDIEDYLLSWVGEDNWEYDFFEYEEIENKKAQELYEEVQAFAFDYAGVYTCDLLDNVNEILKEGEDCEILDEEGTDENLIARDCYDIYASDSFGCGHYETIFRKVLEAGGNIKQFAKFYGFGLYDNKDAEQYEVYKI